MNLGFFSVRCIFILNSDLIFNVHGIMQVFAELPSLKFVKCASLIGHNNNQDMRTRQMQETISKFKDGRVCIALDCFLNY